MRKLLLLVCACTLPLGACATIPTGPGQVAESTILDEQAALGANLAYKTWRLAVETGVEAGLIKGTLAAQLAAIDNQLYSALQAVDAAYRAGNSASYASAVGQFNVVLANAYAALPRSN